jgi:hypothetical protein
MQGLCKFVIRPQNLDSGLYIFFISLNTLLALSLFLLKRNTLVRCIQYRHRANGFIKPCFL